MVKFQLLVCLAYILLSSWSNALSKKIGGVYIKSFHSRYYYVSTSSTTWQSAFAACKYIMGPRGNLLSLKTENEWAFILQMLQKYSTSTNYWTSGTYNPRNNRHSYTWGNGSNATTIDTWATWGKSQPPETENTEDRVAIYHASFYINFWQISNQFASHRYICQEEQ